VTSPSSPVNLAALDIGTNSFHLVVARLLDNGYEVVTREGNGAIGSRGRRHEAFSSDAIERTGTRRMQ
jgi:exopolyphosphatase/pppGpp-phosphohydrolase